MKEEHCDKRLTSGQKQWFNYKQPSLGRVAVVALYTDCDGKTKHMKCKCNRHAITSFRRMMANRLPLCSAPRSLKVGYIMLTEWNMFVKQ